MAVYNLAVLFVLLLAHQITALVPPERRQVSPIPTGTSTTTLQWTVTAISDTESSTTLMAVIASPATTAAWPPPAVTVTVNTEVHITLVNSMPAELSEKVTLHFHGLLMNDGFVSMDGPEGITQCGVSNNNLQNKNTFFYRFVANKPGTYWIHSHDPGQYPKGLRTPFIVTDNAVDSKTYGYENDYAASVSDWYSNFWWAEGNYSTTPGPCGKGIEVFPDGVVFNDGTASMTTRKNTPLDANAYTVAASPPSGAPRRSRFRFVNMSAYSQFFVAVEDHSVYVIEVDGVLLDTGANLAATRTDGFVLAPGQRVSVLLEHKTVAAVRAKPYRILAALDPRMGPAKPAVAGCSPPNFSSGVTPFSYGCLSYGSPDDACDAPTPGQFGMLNFRARDLPGDKGKIPINEPGKQLTLDVPWMDYLHTPYAYPWNFNERLFVPLEKSVNRDTLMAVKPGNINWLKIVDADVTEFGSFDKQLWKPPTTGREVGLIRALDASLPDSQLNSPASYGQPSNTIVVQNPGDVVWLIFETANGDHPIHLHGYHFHVLYKGYEDDTSIRLFQAAAAAYNRGTAPSPWDVIAMRAFFDGMAAATPEHPMRRDTLQAERGQFLVVAFVADNPGVWALHCHNDFHAATGMMRQVVAAPAVLRSKFGTYSLPDGILQTPDVPYAGARTEWISRNIQQCFA